MAKRGRAGPALATAAIGSFVAGSIATVLLTLLAPVVVEIALKFGPAEYFVLMIFAIACLGGMVGDKPVKTLMAALMARLRKAKAICCAAFMRASPWMPPPGNARSVTASCRSTARLDAAGRRRAHCKSLKTANGSGCRQVKKLRLVDARRILRAGWNN